MAWASAGVLAVRHTRSEARQLALSAAVDLLFVVVRRATPRDRVARLLTRIYTLTLATPEQHTHTQCDGARTISALQKVSAGSTAAEIARR